MSGIPEHFLNFNNYNNKEFKVNVKYLGVGYNCKYVTGLTEQNPNEDGFPVSNIEIVEANYFEEIF